MCSRFEGFLLPGFVVQGWGCGVQLGHDRLSESGALDWCKCG